jgi:geranylgeranyl diphosphate synthase type II
LKTGALIRVSAVGAAHLCLASPTQLREIAVYAEALGLAFQVADDILDFNPAKPEPGSYPAILGLAETKKILGDLTQSALSALETWPNSADPLREIAEYNEHRLI